MGCNSSKVLLPSINNSEPNISESKISEPSKSESKNFEGFSLIWLDAQVNTTEDNRQTQKKLRETINQLKTFDNIAECSQYISTVLPDDRLLVIVSGRYSQQLVHEHHNRQQISSIYIFCQNKQKYENWARDFDKIKGIFVELDGMVQQINHDYPNIVRMEEPFSYSSSKSVTDTKPTTDSRSTSDSKLDSDGKSTVELNGEFINSVLLVDVLIRTKSADTDKSELFDICKEVYKESGQLGIINEFKTSYDPKKAVWWYTRECFLYHMVNRALRTQDISLLFLFRFVIGDIYRLLDENRYQSPVHVYRGQKISEEELKKLKSSIGKFISVNSFFSTSSLRHKALYFLEPDEPSSTPRVLFDIDVDPEVTTTKPFADISKLSYFKKECEILFMIGSTFRIMNIYPDDNYKDIFIIKMKLCGDNEHDMKPLFDHMKKEYGYGNKQMTLYSYGDILRQMGKYDMAEKICQRLLKEYPENDPRLVQVYLLFGMIYHDKGDYDSSLVWFNKADQFKRQTNPNDTSRASSLYHWLGKVHRRKGNHEEALKYYNKGIELLSEAQGDNQQALARFYNSIGIIHKEQKNYTEASNHFNKTLSIQINILPQDHPELGNTYTNLGNLHLEQGNYEQAEEHQKRSLEIRKKSLPPAHSDVARSYGNLGLVFEKKGDWNAALVNLQKASEIVTASLSAEHEDVKQIHSSLRRVQSQIISTSSRDNLS